MKTTQTKTKTYTFKVTFKHGFSTERVEASDLGKAWLAIAGYANKCDQEPISIELNTGTLIELLT